MPQIYYASFHTFGTKNCWLFIAQSVFKVSSEIDFWPLALKLVKITFIKEIITFSLEYTSTNFCLKGVKRSVIIFFKSFYQNNRFSGNRGPAKIRLLHDILTQSVKGLKHYQNLLPSFFKLILWK